MIIDKDMKEIRKTLKKRDKKRRKNDTKQEKVKITRMCLTGSLLGMV